MLKVYLLRLLIFAIFGSAHSFARENAKNGHFAYFIDNQKVNQK